MAQPAMARNNKFASVNLNSSYGKPAAPATQPRGPGLRAGGGVGHGGMLVLGRTPGAPALPQKGSRLAIPKPVNLPSLKREHGGHDPRALLLGSGWSKQERVDGSAKAAESPADVRAGKATSREGAGWGTAQAPSESSGAPPAGPPLGGKLGAYMPPAARNEAAGRSAVAAPSPSLLRREDFPTLQAAAPTISPSMPRLREQQQQQQKQKHRVEEIRGGQQQQRGRGEDSEVEMESSQRQSLEENNVSQEVGPKEGDARQVDIKPLPERASSPPSQPPPEHSTSTRSTAQRRIDERWGNDAADSWRQPPRPATGGSPGRSASRSSPPREPVRNWADDERAPSQNSRPVASASNSSERSKTEERSSGWTDERRYGPGSSGRDAHFVSDRSLGDQGFASDGAMARRSVNSDGARYRFGDSYSRVMDTGLEGGRTFRGSQQWGRGPQGPEPGPGRGSGRSQSMPFRGGRGDPFMDMLGSGLASLPRLGIEPPPSSLSLEVKLARKKKEEVESEFRDLEREKFEAELERVQKQKELERQRKLEEELRAAELARAEQEERARLAREEEERRLAAEREAQRAAEQAAREAEAAALRVEEERRALQEEKRRLAEEEERRRENARRKLQELEERIARREAQSKEPHEEAGRVQEEKSQVEDARPAAVLRKDERSRQWEDEERQKDEEEQRRVPSFFSDAGLPSGRPVRTSGPPLMPRLGDDRGRGSDAMRASSALVRRDDVPPHRFFDVRSDMGEDDRPRVDASWRNGGLPFVSGHHAPSHTSFPPFDNGDYLHPGPSYGRDEFQAATARDRIFVGKGFGDREFAFSGRNSMAGRGGRDGPMRNDHMGGEAAVGPPPAMRDRRWLGLEEGTGYRGLVPDFRNSGPEADFGMDSEREHDWRRMRDRGERRRQLYAPPPPPPAAMSAKAARKQPRLPSPDEEEKVITALDDEMISDESRKLKDVLGHEDRLEVDASGRLTQMPEVHLSDKEDDNGNQGHAGEGIKDSSEGETKDGDGGSEEETERSIEEDSESEALGEGVISEDLLRLDESRLEVAKEVVQPPVVVDQSRFPLHSASADSADDAWGPAEALPGESGGLVFGSGPVFGAFEVEKDVLMDDGSEEAEAYEGAGDHTYENEDHHVQAVEQPSAIADDDASDSLVQHVVTHASQHSRKDEDVSSVENEQLSSAAAIEQREGRGEGEAPTTLPGSAEPVLLSYPMLQGPVPAIQIGTIQMPLQFGQLGTTFGQLSPQPLLQFGQLGQPAFLPPSSPLRPAQQPSDSGQQFRQPAMLPSQEHFIIGTVEEGNVHEVKMENSWVEKGKAISAPQAPTFTNEMGNAGVVQPARATQAKEWRGVKPAWSPSSTSSGVTTRQQEETSGGRVGNDQLREANAGVRAGRVPIRRPRERIIPREVVNPNTRPPPAVRSMTAGPQDVSQKLSVGAYRDAPPIRKEFSNGISASIEGERGRGEATNGSVDTAGNGTNEAFFPWRSPGGGPASHGGRGRGAGLLGAGRGRGRGLTARGGSHGPGIEGGGPMGGSVGFTQETGSDGVVVRTRIPVRRGGLRRSEPWIRDVGDAKIESNAGVSSFNARTSRGRELGANAAALLPTPLSMTVPAAPRAAKDALHQPLEIVGDGQDGHKELERRNKPSIVEENLVEASSAHVTRAVEGRAQIRVDNGGRFAGPEQRKGDASQEADDFIQVRSKRQMLNDRREQREKELKTKGRDAKVVKEQAGRKQKTVNRPNGGSSPGKSAVGTTDKAGGVPSGVPVLSSPAQSLSAVVPPATAGSTDSTSPLAPIGKSPAAAASNTITRSSSGNTGGLDTVQSVQVGSERTPIPSSAWGGNRSTLQVVSFAQIQMEESIGPNMRLQPSASVASSDISSHNHGGPPTDPSVPASEAGSISSFLTGGHIQFGTAVTAALPMPIQAGPSVLSGFPAVTVRSGRGQESSASEGSVGMGREEEVMPFSSKTGLKRARFGGQQLMLDPDAEAEAAASAVAAAAMSSDESVGSTRNEDRDAAADIDLARVGSLLPTDAEAFPESASAGNASAGLRQGGLLEDSMAAALPADLSLEPSPAPVSASSPALQTSQLLQRPGGSMSGPPFEMGHVLGGPMFPFNPEAQGRFLGVQGNGSAGEHSLGLAGMGTWAPAAHTTDSFYAAQGFAGPFLSPGGPMPASLPGLPGPPVLLYAKSPFGGQFGQLGMGYLPTYLPTGKQPDWKHTPLGPTSTAGLPMVGTAMDSSQRSPGLAQQRTPPGPTVPMPQSGSGPFEHNLPAPFQMQGGETSLKRHWPRMAALPVRSAAPGPPLLGFAMPGLHPPTRSSSSPPHMASRLPTSLDGPVAQGGGPLSSSSPGGNSFPSSDAAAQFPDELGLGDSSSTGASAAPPASSNMLKSYSGRQPPGNVQSSAVMQGGVLPNTQMSGHPQGSPVGGGGGKQQRPRRPARMMRNTGTPNGVGGPPGSSINPRPGPPAAPVGVAAPRQQQRESVGVSPGQGEHRQTGPPGGRMSGLGGGWGGPRGRGGGGSSRQGPGAGERSSGNVGSKVRQEYVPKVVGGIPRRGPPGGGTGGAAAASSEGVQAESLASAAAAQ